MMALSCMYTSAKVSDLCEVLKVLERRRNDRVFVSVEGEKQEMISSSMSSCCDRSDAGASHCSSSYYRAGICTFQLVSSSFPRGNELIAPLPSPSTRPHHPLLPLVSTVLTSTKLTLSPLLFHVAGPIPVSSPSTDSQQMETPSSSESSSVSRLVSFSFFHQSLPSHHLPRIPIRPSSRADTELTPDYTLVFISSVVRSCSRQTHEHQGHRSNGSVHPLLASILPLLHLRYSRRN